MTAARSLRISRDPAAWRGPLIFGLVVLSIVLGLYQLGERSLWLDETTSVYVAKRFFQDFPFLSDVNMTLYYGVLAIWISIVGTDSETLIRLPSVLFAAATIPVVVVIVERIAGTRAALVAGLFLALNGFLLHYAQEARGYSLVTLLLALSTLLFIEVHQRRSKVVVVAYILVSALAIYTHFFAGFVLASHVVVLVLADRRQLDVPRMVVTYGVIGILALPVLVGAGVTGSCQIGYLQPPETVHIVAGLQAIAGDGTVGGLADPEYGEVGSWLLTVTAMILVLTVFWTVRHRAHARALGASTLWAWLIVPLVLALAISFTAVPVFAWRYLVVLTPAVAALTAIGIVSLRPRPLAVIGTGLIVVLSLVSVFTWTRQPAIEPWREIVASVGDASEPADAIVYYSQSIRKPFAFYAAHQDRIPDMPLEIRAPKPPCGEDGVTQPVADLSRLDPRYHQRVWLVVSHAGSDLAGTELERVIAALNTGYRELERQEWLFKEDSQHNVEVRLYEARDAQVDAP